MSARGTDFLETWSNANIPRMRGNWDEAMKLSEKLRVEAAAAGFAVADLELEDDQIVKYILYAMVHRNEPGT